jgi:hypothetical protein
MSDLFDFGFTAVDENELEAVQKLAEQSKESSASIAEAEEKLNRLYNSILPLLSNLKANPEKEYLYWPNRVAKVEEFEDYISKILEGNL